MRGLFPEPPPHPAPSADGPCGPSTDGLLNWLPSGVCVITLPMLSFRSVSRRRGISL